MNINEIEGGRLVLSARQVGFLLSFVNGLGRLLGLFIFARDFTSQAIFLPGIKKIKSAKNNVFCAFNFFLCLHCDVNCKGKSL